MLALRHFETEMLCPVCGGLASECQTPRAAYAFKVGTPVRCQRRTTQAAYQSTDEWEKRPHREALLLPTTYDPSRVVPEPPSGRRR